jgi:transposase-like protein
MSDEEAERVFIRLRWAGNNGEAFCPHCGCTTVYMARRPSGSARWRCKACRKDFSDRHVCRFLSARLQRGEWAGLTG